MQAHWRGRPRLFTFMLRILLIRGRRPVGIRVFIIRRQRAAVYRYLSVLNKARCTLRGQVLPFPVESGF